ncbi:MAG: cadmium-translocating P-type ATPase [Clostridiales bacterium]|nr:cadmium-translocating P-type ATPase [Clostridiales bacterium]
MTKKFSVSGMTCVNCSSGIERNIAKLDGVNSVSVSLMEKVMTVDFDENILSIEKIIAVVEKLGYAAEVFGSKKVDRFADAKKLKQRFFISLLVLLPLMYFSMGNMLSLPVPKNEINFVIQLVLASVILVLNRKFFINGVKAVINGSPNMDTLVSLGSASAYVYSIVVTVMMFLGKLIPEHTFFEASAMVVALVTLGKWLEELSKIKTGDEIEKLGNLLPKTATVIENGKEKVVLTSELKKGDIILLKAGDYASVDGVIVEGNASVDKSAITGESLPVEVSVGDTVNSGSILKNGYLHLQAEKVGEQTLFSKIVEIVRKAGASKAPIQKLADKISKFFVPTVTIIAIITFIVWIVISGDFYKAFNFGISVLVISCPCSLGLATPVAVMAATGKAASYGILFKNAESLQNACKINCVLLDKTATITVGKPKVTDYINFTDEPNSTIFPVAAALESKSSHPLAECVKNYCGESDKIVTDYSYITGKGIIGTVDGVKYYLGNRELLPDNIIMSEIPVSVTEGKTVLYFADEYQLVSVFAVSDYLKEDSADAIAALHAKNIKTVMITGDNESAAKNISAQVGLDEFAANVLPQDKYEIVEKYKKEGYFVAMVGDGINDSPALKSADIGVAMGTGTDIAIDSSDIVIANGSLSALSKTVEISSKALKIIKQNLFWAFFYNVIGIPIAAGALSALGVVLTPMVASALMSMSSLFVVTNALRIAGKKKKEKSECDSSCGALIDIKVDIKGMMCKHCQGKVTDALGAIQGVYGVKVSLEKNQATFKADSFLTDNAIISAIESVGFTVTNIQR